ncbi:MAG: DUF1622 domain-containing protein [Clostridia bacterium]|nr:DUF1622 domain-containing protein [Clostridia bacterium]
MRALLDKIDGGFDLAVEYGVLLVEIIGVAVLLFSVFRAVWMLLTRRGGVRLTLAEGIALSLEFKMGGELLRTVIVREWNELLVLGSIVLIRAAMAVLIRWEIANAKKTSHLPVAPVCEHADRNKDESSD